MQLSQISKNIWIISITVLATALIAGSNIYLWQKLAADQEINALQKQIDDLENQIKQLQADKKQAAVIVSYPKPVFISGTEYNYFALYADENHIRPIASSLEFLTANQ